MMQKDEIQKTILSSSAFKNLTRDEVRFIVNLCEIKSFEKGAFILSEGEKPPGFYILVDGLVKLYKQINPDRSLILRILERGDLLGFSCICPDKHIPLTARALCDTNTLFISHSHITQKNDIFLKIHQNLLDYLCNTLWEIVELASSISLKSVTERLAEYLAGELPENTGKGVVKLKIKKKDLAYFLGTFPETLSRSFKILSELGLIEVDAKTITILKKDGLLKYGR